MGNKSWALAGLACTAVWQIAGCVSAASISALAGAGGGSGSITVDVALDDPDPALAAFNVTADEPMEKTILLNLPEVQGTVTGGTLSFVAGAITFEPTGPGKGRVAAQVGPFAFEVTGFVFPRDPLGGCGDGDEYGPYTVEIDDTGQAVSVDPSELELLPDTVRLINEGNVAICLRIVSPVTGTIRIGGFEFGLTAGTTETGL